MIVNTTFAEALAAVYFVLFGLDMNELIFCEGHILLDKFHDCFSEADLIVQT